MGLHTNIVATGILLLELPLMLLVLIILILLLLLLLLLLVILALPSNPLAIVDSGGGLVLDWMGGG